MPPLHVFLRGQKGTKPRKPSPNTMKQHTPHHLPRLSCWLRNQCLQSARLYSKYIKIWIQQITMWSTYIIIIHHNSSYIYMTSCSSKHMQHIAAWCMTSPNFFFLLGMVHDSKSGRDMSKRFEFCSSDSSGLHAFTPGRQTQCHQSATTLPSKGRKHAVAINLK